MKLAFIIDPIHSLDPGHDSSVAIMEAACQQGDQVWVTPLDGLMVQAGRAWAILTPVMIHPVKLVEDRWQPPTPWYTQGKPELLPLDTLDAVFMRQDPPVTVTYLYATYLLDYIDPAQTLIINNPQGIRAANEKMYALQFTDLVPTTLVTGSKAIIRQFLEAQGSAVLKPLGGKAGEGILFLKAGDPNLNSLIEISTQRGQEPVMVQEYLPAAKAGDKRIILLNGLPIGAVNRVPDGEDFRGNMAAGGQGVATTLTERDRFICQQVGPQLQRDGLIFVGIDVIGDRLTEINVTSPTGIREIDRLSQTQLGHQVIDWVRQNRPRSS